jgi:hypothetical protein
VIVAKPLLYALPVPTSVAVPIVGACGTVVAITELEFAEDAEEPDELTATILNV